MNLLTDKPPKYVDIAGERVELLTDYRRVLIFIKAHDDEELDTSGRLELLLKLFFKKEPCNLNAAIIYIMKTYLLGGSPFADTALKRKAKKAAKIVFDYDIDSARIYASFWQQYRIDLTKAKLHWYVFKALFEGLNEQTTFRQIVNFRQMRKKDVPKEMRQEYADALEELKIPLAHGPRRSAKEIEAELIERASHVRK
ncbi:MAG: bacteriophage Gp15 family protein [Endomicrobium sp.]|jgi:hypothetical protein|nr:bacteriophage Gp15 family protein [Endomicrobium sp.]